ncbi:tetratricopeptide repeat protein [Hyphomonas sp.]|uniref:tetratricopeptide repeat protein n=1 Tax=Hyphomonas sp. TaxID=87 RepID=UPI0032424500
MANTGSEKWAFAISAEKKWTAKARRDVRKIAETERSYERIFFITSRHARAKDRGRLEDELSQTYGIPVTIHDRTWIVDEVVEKDRLDLAFNFLGAGQAVPGGAKLGPNDYSRTQQLEDLEKEIQDPTAFHGMEMQLASEALVAAKLSRNLERARTETDGRFARAIDLAEKYGTYRQKLEANYEHIWTAFWWFNDIDFLLSHYDAFEARAIESDNAVDLEWLGNLHQLLVNCITHNHASIEDTKLWERVQRLEAKLQALADDPERPNNRLEARSGLLRIRLNNTMLKGELDALPSLWNDYAAIVDAARGLGEFNFQTLVEFIEVVGNVAGNDPAYNALIEKCAELVAERTSESEAALMYLNRAKKLDLDDNFDMIRWLGKAAVGLSKHEYSDELIEATQLLSLAYRSAGLLWAARASCAMATATMFIEGERTNHIPVALVPTMKLWAWISLELGHLPDFLHNIQLLNGFLAGLPLDDESKSRVQKDLQEFDIAIGSLLLNLDESELTQLTRLPDLLGGLGLHMARMALLYAMGHIEILRTDGSIPAEESDEDILDLMTQMKNQPVSQDAAIPLVLNAEGTQSLQTSILGMRVVVEFESSELISLAETILGVLETFFATAIEQRVAPHTEHYRVVLMLGDGFSEPEVESDPSEMKTIVRWPSSLAVTNYGKADEIRTALLVIAAHVLATGCSTSESEGLLERLFDNEAVLHRIAIIIASPNSYKRLFRQAFSRLSDWNEHNPEMYEIRDSRPIVPVTERKADPGEVGSSPNDSPPRSHKALGVRSVIDLQTWNKAVWRGCGFLHTGPDLPPIMLLLFEDEAAGRKIFERWRERFGEQDEADEIAISFIRELPEQSPHHYIAQITSRLPDETDPAHAKLVTSPIRSLMVTPPNSDNLDRFLAAYQRFGVYAIAPGIMPTKPDTPPEVEFDLAIQKRMLDVKNAAEVDENEAAAISLQMHERHTDR